MSARSPSGDAPPPGDPGLQVERTTLAWLRTTLSFVVSAMVLVRLFSHSSTVLAAVCAGCTLPLAAAATWYTLRRHQHNDHNVRMDLPLPDGTLPIAITTLAVLLGTMGIVYVITD